MITRRDWIIGGVCSLGAAASVAMEPRRRVSRLGSLSLETAAPLSVGGFNGLSTSELLAPAEPGSLTARLYDQSIGRRYTSDRSDQVIDLLLAHGAEQSNERQLHRPEVCYPAFGYRILSSKAETLPLARGGQLPVRVMQVQAQGRQETVLYWTRLGDALPTSGEQQRIARVRLALKGEIDDGVLVRFSMHAEDAKAGLATLRVFARQFVDALSPEARVALLGLPLSRQA
jgi:EpsI family protein